MPKNLHIPIYNIIIRLITRFIARLIIRFAAWFAFPSAAPLPSSFTRSSKVRFPGWLTILALTTLPLPGFSQQAPAPTPPYWQQQTNYNIDVTLNPQDHTLDAWEKIQYINNSPDTLHFIWMHCWPNAYKTDRSALSEQMLENGRTDFYFSDEDKKGYINRLDFRVDDLPAGTIDHPLYLDILQLVLPRPLAPGGQIIITTPFHEKIPFAFSREGYTDHIFQITQWYPKPAVYDSRGWHEMPYLDQGEFYSEYGNFQVHITVPANYIVGASGRLLTASELALYNDPRHFPDSPAKTPPGHPSFNPHQQHPAHYTAHRTNSSTHPSPHPAKYPPANAPAGPPPATTPLPTKTLAFSAENVHDFAWFASSEFNVRHDTLRLHSGKTIDLYAYYTPLASPDWSRSMQYMKDAISFRSSLIGDYPYPVASVVAAPLLTGQGMEYPGIASIDYHLKDKQLDLVIEHEIGHNWFYAALGTNERRYPWMDEGINSYYNSRYASVRYPNPAGHANAGIPWLLNKFPDDADTLLLNTVTTEKRDQSISTSSERFTTYNYALIPYFKTARWMKTLEDSLGTSTFDTAMRYYFATWRCRHPYPEDFKQAVETASGQDLSHLFSQLDQTGPLTTPAKRRLKPTFLFSLRQTDKYDYINISPAIGANKYDGALLGILLHNYNLPPDPFRFLLAPLYGANSHQWGGLERLSYDWYSHGPLQKITLSLAAEKFSSLSATDSNGNKLFGGFYKVAPALRLNFRSSSPRSTLEQWIELKTYLIGEKTPTAYVIKSTDSLDYPSSISKYAFRYLNQLSYHVGDKRTLYPYNALLQLQQADRFYRINFTGNYFFNYAGGGGMDLRLFAAKFGYLGGRDNGLDLSPFMPKLTGVSGSEDYTYSNYFYGRNEFTGFASQQIMIRDGGFKIRVPSFPWLEGRSDNWVSAINLTSTLPHGIIPSWLPLKAFLDAGSYAGGWQAGSLTSRFLYDAGLQLSLFHNVLNFYAPLFYSKDFSDQLHTVPDLNTFWKKLSFSIDFQPLSLRKALGNIPL